jgi:hypothetical protein
MTEKKVKNISNADIRNHVDKLHEFETNNKTVYSVKSEEQYAVYSYGYHFPMYVYDFKTEVWLGNKDKSTPTTMRHLTKARPSKGIHQWFTTEDLKTIIVQGYTQTITQRLERAYG